MIAGPSVAARVREENMAEGSAYELKRNDRVYRAPGLEVLVRWARERRISADDAVRKAGTQEWSTAVEVPELTPILDPSNWWTVRMGDDSWLAPDFETIIRWTREGRLSTDAVVEGPRTPPGGILAQGLPRLSPLLRPPAPKDPSSLPPRLRIDGAEYDPGSIDAIRSWILESRVPPDADISLAGGPWEPVSECGLFEPELWPAGAWGEDMPDEEEIPSQAADEPVPDAAGVEPAAVSAPEPVPEGEAGAESGPESPDGWRIVTLTDEFVIAEPAELIRLLRNRRIHTFDDVVHPSLPDGRCSVDRAIDLLHLRRNKRFPWLLVWILVLLALAAAFLWLDPLQLHLLR